ncbi:MAG: ThiF family adenylyltransferase [Candidatus Hodarchaeales archaeon]|jgi:molybdopterin/thiamine biosynthesis adenylyltransferase
MNSNPPASKFDRQERLSIWNQNLIEESCVLIIGIGGTGGEVAKNLALLGIGKLILVDMDTIEYSNLNRQLLFSRSDIGKNKAQIAKKVIIRRYNSSLKIEAFTEPIQSLPFRLFEEADIIAGCVDNFLARQYINETAIELPLSLLDSATDGYFGQVQNVNLNSNACLACDSPPPPEETRLLTAPCTLVGTPRTKEHCAWKALYEFHTLNDREPVENSPEDVQELTNLANKFATKHNFPLFDTKEVIQAVLFHVPSLITVNAVTSGIQSQEIIKTLFLNKMKKFNMKDQKQFKSLVRAQRFRLPDLTIYSALTGNISSFELAKDPNCLVCGNSSIYRETPHTININPKSKCKTIFTVLKRKFKKNYVGFRGNFVIPNDALVGSVLQDGDRITVSSLSDDEERRIKIRFNTKKG